MSLPVYVTEAIDSYRDSWSVTSAIGARSRLEAAIERYAQESSPRQRIKELEKALRMIEEFRGETNGFPMNDGALLMWAREFAHEALAGIDPTTGKPFTGAPRLILENPDTLPPFIDNPPPIG